MDACTRMVTTDASTRVVTTVAEATVAVATPLAEAASRPPPFALSLAAQREQECFALWDPMIEETTDEYVAHSAVVVAQAACARYSADTGLAVVTSAEAALATYRRQGRWDAHGRAQPVHALDERAQEGVELHA
mmetsp:Transcript_25842/g.59746  ORF Transcript_25842/g.59746 Transcript_25842/m.59746 type:complete len:134 (-) Transcript_25842:755-1156(-)